MYIIQIRSTWLELHSINKANDEIKNFIFPTTFKSVKKIFTCQEQELHQYKQ